MYTFCISAFQLHISSQPQHLPIFVVDSLEYAKKSTCGVQHTLCYRFIHMYICIPYIYTQDRREKTGTREWLLWIVGVKICQKLLQSTGSVWELWVREVLSTISPLPRSLSIPINICPHWLVAWKMFSDLTNKVLTHKNISQ